MMEFLPPSLDNLLKPDLKTPSLEDEGGGTKQAKTKIFLVVRGNEGKLGSLTWEEFFF